ncbi:MAG TPA: F0F1 ATP synthase subunit A [Candidatus Deferrimicrobiaceae bacterium]|jgi:F-type H+-transporting ATPase subunit a|nr:F0F1 ATP synthase subunit A [Candidatus Deferrimicrobiaceae bacterium]
MHEQLWFTAILNRLFGGPVASLLRVLHIQPRRPAAPISDSFAMELLVFAFLLIVFLLVRSRLSVDRPGPLQHVFEGAEGFIRSQSEEIIGHHSEPYTAFLAALGFFILFCNLIGVIPGFESPTAIPVVPLGCAICAFFYYQAQGFKHAGIGYLKHFAGPMPILAPLMVPIELISHLARVLSLTIRLFANMFAGDMVTLVFFSLVPIGVPIIFLGLHIGVSLLQTYIFVLLTTVYLQGAVSEEH